MAPLSRGVMSVFCNVITPQGLEPFQFSTKISSPSLLSLGDDGHIASLFPGRTDLGEDGRLVIPVVDSPKLPSRRVTMTLGMINRAKRVYVLAAGTGKADALAATMHAVRRGERDTVQWPATGIRVEHERVVWWADRAAAERLDQ